MCGKPGLLRNGGLRGKWPWMGILSGVAHTEIFWYIDRIPFPENSGALDTVQLGLAFGVCVKHRHSWVHLAELVAPAFMAVVPTMEGVRPVWRPLQIYVLEHFKFVRAGASCTLLASAITNEPWFGRVPVNFDPRFLICAGRWFCDFVYSYCLNKQSHLGDELIVVEQTFDKCFFCFFGFNLLSTCL